MDTITIRDNAPKVPRPDHDQDTPHGCYDGWVYLGFESGAEEDGELVEITDRVPCRRCNAGELR